ncbi:MAG: hypothetical protein U5K28_12380 [Halobacteriales archaeon]|nr:hypothetical protein [Halobacteriales archaeon]
MTTHRAVAALVVLLAVSAGAPPVAGAAATTTANDGFLYLTTSTDPVQPTTSANFTFTARLTNPEASTETYSIRSIEVYNGDPSEGGDRLDRRTYEGRVAPGGSKEIPLDIGFDNGGTKTLFVEIDARQTGGDALNIETTTTIEVYEPTPRIEASAAGTVDGQPTDLTVGVANGLDVPVRDVNLALNADGVTFDESSRVASSVAAGAERDFTFTATPAELGVSDIKATLSYTDSDGTRRTTTETLAVRFRPPDLAGDIDVGGSVAPAFPGAETTLSVNVTNGLDQQVRQLAVEVTGENVELRTDRRVGTKLASGAGRTFTFPVVRDTTGAQSFDVMVTYTTANGVERQTDRTLQTRFTEPANPAEISLTGVETTVRDGQLELSATASNLGGGPASSVIVEVGGENVAASEYFVGSVDGSDFAAFTLTADVTGNVSSVPVTVRYDVGDTERSYTQERVVERVEPVEESDGGGGLPILLVGLFVIALVVGGVLIRRRN